MAADAGAPGTTTAVSALRTRPPRAASARRRPEVWRDTGRWVADGSAGDGSAADGSAADGSREDRWAGEGAMVDSWSVDAAHRPPPPLRIPCGCAPVGSG